MGNIWLLIAAPATVLAAILFWRVFDIQHSDYTIQRVETAEERAQFNADFSAAWAPDGKPDPAKVAAAEAAAAKRKQLEAEAAKRSEQARAKAQAEVDKLDALLGAGLQQEVPQPANTKE